MLYYLAANSVPNLDTVTTPSENATNTEIDMQGAGAAHSVHNTLSVSTFAEAGKDREGLKVLQTTASKGQKLQLLFDHLNDFLVSSPPSIVVVSPENEVNIQQMSSQIPKVPMLPM